LLAGRQDAMRVVVWFFRETETGKLRALTNQPECFPVSKHPTPRIDQLRAMREAQFASNAARQKAAEQPEKPVAEKPVKTEKPAAPAKSAPAKSAKKTPAKPKPAKKPGK
jgi:hypothetical protein